MIKSQRGRERNSFDFGGVDMEDDKNKSRNGKQRYDDLPRRPAQLPSAE